MENIPDPDAQLLQQLTTGEVDEATWQGFLQRIRGWISHHYPSLAYQVDDLAEEAALCAFVSLPSFRGEARFIRWVHRLTHHVVSRHLHKQAGVIVVSFEDMSNEVSTGDEIDRYLLHVIAEVAMQILTDQERTVFLARVTNDEDHREIAQRLGISYNASRQTWTRATEKIKRYRQQNPW